MDATRISDGRLVAMKRIDTTVHPFEIDIARYLSSENWLPIPVIDAFLFLIYSSSGKERARPQWSSRLCYETITTLLLIRLARDLTLSAKSLR